MDERIRINLCEINNRLQYDKYGIFFATDIVTHDDLGTSDCIDFVDNESTIFVLFTDMGLELGNFMLDKDSADDTDYLVQEVSNIIKNAFIEENYSADDDEDFMFYINDMLTNLQESLPNFVNVLEKAIDN